MELIILGSGTGVPSVRRASPAYLLRLPGRCLLLDCGPGALRQLAAAGVTIDRLDYILLSHLHPDHTVDLPAYLFALKYAGLPPRATPCRLVGRTGLAEFIRRLRAAWGRWIEPEPGQVEVVEAEPGGVQLPSGEPFSLHCAEPEHTPQSLAWRIEAGGCGLVYSGDTGYSERLVALARSADLFLCECSFPEAQAAPGHSTPRLAGRMAREAGVRRLVLTHLYPPADEADVAAEAAAEFAADIVVAEDGLRLAL